MAKDTPLAKGLYSPWQILGAASAYYKLSKVFTDTLPDDSVELSQIIFDASSLTASATNRILARELYLKALLVGSSVAVAMVHNLVTLFDALPEDTRRAITTEYDRRAKARVLGRAWIVSHFVLPALG